MPIKFLHKALQELDQEAAYIAKDSPDATRRFVQAIQEGLHLVVQYPAMGHPGRVPETREWVMTDFPYIIPYRVRQRRLEVLRIFHTTRRPPKHW